MLSHLTEGAQDSTPQLSTQEIPNKPWQLWNQISYDGRTALQIY